MTTIFLSESHEKEMCYKSAVCKSNFQQLQVWLHFSRSFVIIFWILNLGLINYKPIIYRRWLTCVTQPPRFRQTMSLTCCTTTSLPTRIPPSQTDTRKAICASTRKLASGLYTVCLTSPFRRKWDTPILTRAWCTDRRSSASRIPTANCHS